MAKAKAQSKSGSSKATKQSRSTKSASAKSAKTRGAQVGQSLGKSADQSVAQASYKRAKDFVGTNANLPTAGFALAGAGLLALISTQAGRNLMKSAAEAVISLVNSPAITEAIPESIKAPFKSSDKSQALNSKTDFASSKRATGKSASKSV